VRVKKVLVAVAFAVALAPAAIALDDPTYSLQVQASGL